MRHKMNVLFWIRKTNTEAVVYCTVTINGVRSTAFTTNIKINPDFWDSQKQLITNDEIKQSTLVNIKQRLAAIHLDMELKGEKSLIKIRGFRLLRFEAFFYVF